MSLVLRTLTYATLFVALVLVYLPGRVLTWAGMTPSSAASGSPILKAVALLLCGLGAALALWCVATFVVIGKGTPAPFDPPRRLVIRGPYRYVRNPMYIGAALAVSGAALFYRSWALLAFTAAFLLVCHTFVCLYEEPTLRRTFGSDYETYCRHVHRWRPGR